MAGGPAVSEPQGDSQQEVKLHQARIRFPVSGDPLGIELGQNAHRIDVSLKGLEPRRVPIAAAFLHHSLAELSTSLTRNADKRLHANPVWVAHLGRKDCSQCPEP